jgi:hypothetical protein
MVLLDQARSLIYQIIKQVWGESSQQHPGPLKPE